MNYQNQFIELIQKSKLLEEIQNFYEEYKPHINISTENEEAFRLACENGNLEVAKWLYQIKPTIDVSAKNDYAFCYTCENGNLNVAKWLQTLMPYGLYYTFQVGLNN